MTVNLATKQKCAMKIIKSEDRYVESAKLEINVLKKIREADLKNEYSCIALLDDFMYKGHPCLRVWGVSECTKAECNKADNVIMIFTMRSRTIDA